MPAALAAVVVLCPIGYPLPHGPSGEELACAAGHAGGLVHQLLRVRDPRAAALRPVHAPLCCLLPAGEAQGKAFKEQICRDASVLVLKPGSVFLG